MCRFGEEVEQEVLQERIYLVEVVVEVVIVPVL